MRRTFVLAGPAWWVVIGILLAITACAGPPPAAPTATPVPTNTPAPPAPTATATLIPTATPAPTPAPTFTPTPEPSPTPIPTLTPTPTPLPDGPLVRIGDAVYVVDLAVTGAERTQGLSGRPSLETDRGMLFVYDNDAPRAFWMPEMHFPLDMVWIKSDCTVVGVTADVPNPPPDTPHSELPHYPATGPARFVLEINAGQAETHNIAPGASVKFDGHIAGKWGC